MDTFHVTDPQGKSQVLAACCEGKLRLSWVLDKHYYRKGYSGNIDNIETENIYDSIRIKLWFYIPFC